MFASGNLNLPPQRRILRLTNFESEEVMTVDIFCYQFLLRDLLSLRSRESAIGVGARHLAGQSWGSTPSRGKSSLPLNVETDYDVHPPSHAMVGGDS
jgi:hypothetical protein